MGGGSSKQNKTKNVKNAVEQNWETVETGESYNIVKHRIDGRLAEEYSYTLDNKYDPAGEAHIFTQRSKTNLPIVRAYDHQWDCKSKGSLPKNNFRVVTERFTHRLSNTPQLT